MDILIGSDYSGHKVNAATIILRWGFELFWLQFDFQNEYSANNPQGGSVVIRVANLNDSAHPQRLTGPPSCFTHSEALSQQKHVAYKTTMNAF